MVRVDDMIRLGLWSQAVVFFSLLNAELTGAFAPSLPYEKSFPRVSSRISFSPSGVDGDDSLNERELREFVNLEPVLESEASKKRKEEQSLIRSKFVSFGNDLWDLRHNLNDLALRVVEAITLGNDDDATHFREKMINVESKDAELVYMLEMEECYKAYREGRDLDAEAHKSRAMEARTCLPHFNLAGLWCGAYDRGEQLINVTYIGDTLVATKVTGDCNVPAGEQTFQADLHPVKFLEEEESENFETAEEDTKSNRLEPVILSEDIAEKFGTRQLPRYEGKGHVAEDGFRNNVWVDGQLIIAGEDAFSFAWMELEVQIMFTRPSDEKVLRLLSKQPMPSERDPLKTKVQYISQCFENTEDHLYSNTNGDAGCIFDSEDSTFH